MDVGDGDLDPPGVGKCINLVEDVVDPNLEFVQDSGCEGSMENMELNPSSNMCFESGCVGNGISMENMELLNPSSPLIGSQQVVYTSPIQTVRTVQTVETVVSTNVPLFEPPKEGMVFKSWEDIEEYFKMYAFSNGFGVTRVQGSFPKATKERRATRWRCECWGPLNMRALREAKKRAKAMEFGGTGGKVNGVIGVDEPKQGKRKSKNCFCPANIYASVNDAGEWVIRLAEQEHHGHKPTPTKANLVKEYRLKHYTSSVRKKLMNFYEEGVPVKKTHGCLSHEKDKLPNVKDLEHEVYKAKKLKMEGGDAIAMMKYFEKMQADNQNFYRAHRLDEEGRLKDVLLVDARSRAAYEDFGDVVCFDATYLTNNYELPFANFVGVNHHGQSILFGCALVSREDCETYSWVFTQWLACMGNRAPLGILTDQAAAMRRPLAEIMPTARHRWCIWHIMRKLPEKLGKCELYAEFKNPLKALIYESFTVEEFESRWLEFMKKYGLEENEWLCDLFEERHMWIPAYMKEYFWAGMKTTQRVESINSFFDGFVNRKTKLYEFPEKYSKAMTSRVTDETEADAKSTKYVRRIVSGFKVEKVYQKLYADAKFQEIQKEMSRMMYCYGREERVIDEHNVHYYLEDRVWIVPEGRSEEVITDRRRIYCVRFNRVTNEVSCDCCKFETFGIFCKHCIRVLDQNLVFKIPDKYILDRWRKDVVRKHTRVKVAYHDQSDTAEVKRFNKIMSEFEPIWDEASAVDEDTVHMVLASLSKLRIEVKERRKKFIAQNGVQLLPSRQYPPSEKGSTGGVITPSSVTKPSAVYEGWVDGSIQEDVKWVELEPEVTETPVDPPPAVSQQVLDPKSRKRPRGRPKGSRNKSLVELGYKKKNKEIPAAVDETEPRGDEIVAPTPAEKQPIPKRKGRKKKAAKKGGNAGEVAATNPTSSDERVPPAEKPIPKRKGRKRKATTKRGAAGEGVATPTSSFEF